MTLRMRDIFIREDLVIPSQNKIKRALLTGFLSVMCMLISTFYLLYNRIYKIEDAYTIYYVLMAAGVTGFYTNKNGYHTLAKIVVLGVGTLVVFLFSAKANFRTDTHFFYIVISLSSFVLFGFEHRGFAIAFTLLTIFLFAFSFLTGYSFLASTGYPESYVRTNQVINFTIATITAGVILYYVVRLNHMSEETLNIKQEEITLQNQVLTKTNAELDRFVYSTSHDLRAPLASVLGLIHIAKRTADPKEVQQYLDMMASRIHRLDEFIHEIIDFSRNSRTEVQAENIEIRQMIDQILENLKHTMTEHDIEFHVNVPDNLYVSTDISRLKVILNNLIGNAIKYSDASKDNSFIRIEASRMDKGCSISVNDNGVGIDREHQPKIFDMFYRASELSKGSGLGLYIVKESVHKLHGSIHLRSQPGMGSSFIITLPENINS